jgi:hypothetical protein
MGNVKIKRVKRNKKEVTVKEKLLAGLGLVSSLGSAGAGFANSNKTAIISTVSGASGGNNTQIKQTLENIFGIPIARADFVLTAQNASTTTYDPTTISSDDMTGIHDALVSLIQNGQVPTIDGGSVTAYMLGWGSSGGTQTVLGQIYTFDGANWQLQAAPIASAVNINSAATVTTVTALTASTTPYDTTVSQGNMTSIHDQLVSMIQAGQVPAIDGNSVTAYMLGWGGAASGSSQTILGQTYNFDGINWDLQQQAPLVPVPAEAAPVLSSAQGYNPATGAYTNNTVTAGQYLVLYGSFPASDNSVAINGQSLTPDYQSASQLNVQLSGVNLSGLSSINVMVSNQGGTSQSLNVEVSVPPPAIKQIIISGTPNGGTVGQAYNAALTASNGTGGYSWTAQGLPTGLSIDPGAGVITGTPTQSGNFTFTVTAGDGVNAAGSQQFVLNISPAPTATSAPAETAPTISGIQGFDAATGQYLNGNNITAGKYLVLYGSFSANNDNQVSIDGQQAIVTAQTQNQINIQLDADLASGNHNVTVSNGGGTSAAGVFSVTAPVVQAPVVTQITVSGTPAAGTAGQSYSASLSATNGNGNYTWSITGNLPTGLTFNNGQITGIPTQSGNFTFTVTAGDGVNTPGSQIYTLQIAPAPIATPTAPTISNPAPVTVTAARVQQIITGANTIAYGSLSSAEQSALASYLTDNPTALTGQNFTTFAPGSVFAWALGMGTGTSLNLTAQSLGFTSYDSGQELFVEQTVQTPSAPAPAATSTVTAPTISGPASVIQTSTSISPAPAPVSTPTNQTAPVTQQVTIPTQTAAITGTQGFNPATDAYTDSVAVANTFLVLYGTFDASGDTVAIDGQAATVTAQTQNQINVSLNGFAAGNHSVVVVTSFGSTAAAQFGITAPPASTATTETAPTIAANTTTAANSATAAPAPQTNAAPVLNSAQGYNDVTKTYETTANTISAADTYLILYGNFTPSGNAILINGQALPDNPLIVQTAGQINIPLKLIGVTDQTFTVSVSNANLTSQALAVTVPVVSAKNIQAQAAVAASQINAPAAFLQGLTPIGSPQVMNDQNPYGNVVNNGIVNQYTVQYYQMADGETEGVFTYSGQGITDYAGWTFVVRPTGIARIMPDGSVQVLPQADWAPGQGPTMSPLNYIVQHISQGMPANAVIAPGLNFSTPLGASLPANTFMLNGLYPVVLNFDGSGSLVSLQSANATGYGSGFYWFRVGNGYIDTQTDVTTNQPIYYLQFPGMAGSSALILQNVSVTDDSSGNPTQLTAQVNGTNLTLNIAAPLASAGTPVNSATLQMIDVNPDASGTPQYLVVSNGQIVGLPGGAAVNAYQYVVKNNLANATVTATPSGNYQVTIGSGSTQQTLTFNAGGQVNNAIYQNQIDEQNGLVVLQNTDGTLDVAYGSSNPAAAQTLDNVTLTKDNSGNITSVIGTDASGSTVDLVAVGNLWAAVPVNPDGTLPNLFTNNASNAQYPSLTFYGQDPETGQMSAVLTLSNVYFSYSGINNNIAALNNITGTTSNGSSLSLNIGNGSWNTNNQGIDLSTLTFTSMGTAPDGEQEWMATVNGQPYQEVNDQGKAVLQYAQQNNLQIIDFGQSVPATAATAGAQGNNTTPANNLSQYYTLIATSGTQVIDGSSGQVVTDSGILGQISQALGASTPNFGDLSWVTNALQASAASGASAPALYISGPTPIFILNTSVYQAIDNSVDAAFGWPSSPSGGITVSVSTLQQWAQNINQAMANNNGQVPANMQAMVNFMTQLIPVYDQNGNQTGTTSLASLNSDPNNLDSSSSGELALNSSLLTNLQTQSSTDPLSGSLIMISLSDNQMNNPNIVTNAVQNVWESATMAHELQHAGDGNDLQTNYNGDVNAWLNNSSTAQYVQSLPGVVQAFIDIDLGTSSAGYNLADPYSVVTETAARATDFSTIIATLESNSANFSNNAAALQWALTKAGVNATVVNNDDGTINVIANGNTMSFANMDNPSQMTIASQTQLGVLNLYTGIGQANSTAYAFGVSSTNQIYLTDITVNGSSISQTQGKDLNIQLNVPGVGTVTVGKSGATLPDGTPLTNGDDITATNNAINNLLANGQGSGTVTFMNKDENGNDTGAAFNLVINGSGWSWTAPNGSPLAILPDTNGDGGTGFYTIEQASGGIQYQQIDNSGQATGASITKNTNGTIIIDDGQGDTLTRNPDGSGVEKLTVQSQDADTGGSATQVITVSLDSNGNVTSWTDGNGSSYTGNNAAFANMLSQTGLAPLSGALPDLSDPASVSQYLNNVSQQVSSQQNSQTSADQGNQDDGSGDGG